MTRRQVTISDVASHAGVSKGLVSFALNDRDGVAPQTRRRILDAAAELGWRPSVTARSLSNRTSLALGFVLRRNPDVLAADPFFAAFMSGVESVLAPRGWALVLSMVSDAESELQTYRRLCADHRVDGVFLSDLRHDDARIELLRVIGASAVTLGYPEERGIFPAVDLDDTLGVTQMVRHLVSQGHRRIAHVAGTQEMLHGSRRRGAFCGAMAAAGLQPDMIIGADFSAAAGAQATKALLDQRIRPTAIVYANDPMAIAGLGVLQHRGIRVPADMSITGFDGIDLGNYVHPALTTVGSDAHLWGQSAAETLLALITNHQAPDLELPPAELMLRSSTAPPAPAGNR